jgi:dienelactone hydrolase
MGYRILTFFALLLLVAPQLHAQTATPSRPEGPAQIVYAPPSGRGRVVVGISGASGINKYQFVGTELSKAGYYVVLLDGNEILNQDGKGGTRLSAAIRRAQNSPNASPGKVAVFGYSQGGGAAIFYATLMPRTVVGVIAYYPSTQLIRGAAINEIVAKWKVPVLIFAGGEDTYHNCCLIETARAIAAAGKAQNLSVTLVEYPHATHGFMDSSSPTSTLPPAAGAYNSAAAQDAWKRTLATLHTYFDH